MEGRRGEGGGVQSNKQVGASPCVDNACPFVLFISEQQMGNSATPTRTMTMTRILRADAKEPNNFYPLKKCTFAQSSAVDYLHICGFLEG